MLRVKRDRVCPVDITQQVLLLHLHLGLRNLFIGRCPNGFPGLSLDDGTILFLEILFDETISVG